MAISRIGTGSGPSSAPHHGGSHGGASTQATRISFDIPLGEYGTGTHQTPGSSSIKSITTYEYPVLVYNNGTQVVMGQNSGVSQSGPDFRQAYTDVTVHFHKPSGSSECYVAFFSVSGEFVRYLVPEVLGGLMSVRYSDLKQNIGPIDGVSVRQSPGGYISHFEVTS